MCLRDIGNCGEIEPRNGQTDKRRPIPEVKKKKERELKGQISKPRPIEQSLKRGKGLPKARRGEPNCKGPKHK